jgi:pilus assembly protein FimV
LVALEESLNRLRTEPQATQTSLATLQAQLKAAETQRYSNPLVYVLAWLAALLAVAVAALLWRQKTARRAPQWWAQQAPARAVEVASEPASTAPPPDQTSPAPTQRVAFAPARRVAAAPAPLVDSSRPMWADSRLTEAPPDMVPEPRRDLSVEELIDLEQQAEFFVVLGQDEAAIDLLMGHVRNTGGISPLPYLKLLEIYKRRGDRSAYERIRERFNRRFNAYAPDWDADLQHGKSLEDYPRTMVKLEGLWGAPQRVMEVLDAMLFRRDENEEAYDLPAYRELLFLYSVARDFTTGAAPADGGDPSVDLLLPLDEPHLTLHVGQPLAASTPPARGTALDLDMTSPMPADFEPAPRPARQRAATQSDFLDLPELPTGPGHLGR